MKLAAPDRVFIAGAKHGAPAKIRQREGRPPIAAEGSAEDREQRLILPDRQQGAVSERPPAGTKWPAN